jgi:hypothetical protein
MHCLPETHTVGGAHAVPAAGGTLLGPDGGAGAATSGASGGATDPAQGVAGEGRTTGTPAEGAPN